MTNSEEFRTELQKIFVQAEGLGLQAMEISAGALHRRVGDYPGKNHRMPTCCDAMRQLMKTTDNEIPNTLKKNGASFAINYKLPR